MSDYASGPCPTRLDNQPTASARPWHYGHAASIEGAHWDIYAGEGIDGWLVGMTTTEADAALIVQAVNAAAPAEGLDPTQGFAADRPTGPRTEKGHALASRLRTRMPDAEVDWDAWIRAIEDAAEAWGTFRGMEVALTASAEGPDPCPHCDMEHVWPCPTIPRCDEPGCEKATSFGFPTDTGYRRTCGDHYRAAEAER